MPTVGEVKSLVHLGLGLSWESCDGVVEEMVEELLAKFVLNVVVEGFGVKSVMPERVSEGMSLYCVIGWSKEGRVV